jgi:hypothetical protein
MNEQCGITIRPFQSWFLGHVINPTSKTFPEWKSCTTWKRPSTTVLVIPGKIPIMFLKRMNTL